MSKRQKQKNKQTKDIEAEQQFSPLPTASLVTVKISENLSNSSLDQQLLKHYIKSKMMQKKRIDVRELISINLFGRDEMLQIINVQKVKSVHQNHKIEEGKNQKQQEQSKLFLVNANCDIAFLAKEQLLKQKKQEEVCKYYGDSNQYHNFKKIVWENFNLRDELFKVKLGSIRGIIVGGPTGTGKSTFIQRLKADLQSQQIEINEKIFFHMISATQLLSRVVGGAEQYVRKTFRNLSDHKYSIFVIEDMHLLFGQKQISSHETTLATLFSEMDNFSKALIVIGTYNSERDLSSVVFQSGRFQKQISLNLPNHHQRLEILNSMIADMNLSLKLNEDDVKQFNLRLNGYSLGQIKQILRDAYINKKKQITKQILFETLRQYRPSEIKELIVEVPEVYWYEIGGYEQVKHQIRKVTELPLKYPHKFEQLGIQPSKGVLLYGPPGCSKTMMAKAIATQSKLNFIGIKGPELYSKYVGQSERAIRNVFKKARAFSPCIVFFDQIDALATQRNDQYLFLVSRNDVTNRLLGQLLTQMDGVQGLKEVVIIAATNRPEILDEALTRPGRFDHLIYIGPPDLQARKQIFRICLKKTPLNVSLEQICQKMSEKAQNYTGAEINLLCRQAALYALQENIQNPLVKLQNFDMAFLKVKSRLTSQSIARYENFRDKINQKGEQQFLKLSNSFANMGLGDKSSANPFKF